MESQDEQDVTCRHFVKVISVCHKATNIESPMSIEFKTTTMVYSTPI